MKGMSGKMNIEKKCTEILLNGNRYASVPIGEDVQLHTCEYCGYEDGIDPGECPRCGRTFFVARTIRVEE